MKILKYLLKEIKKLLTDETGATNYPTSLDSYATLTDNTDDVLASHPNDRGDAVEALEAKLGVDSSAVATSHDYFLAHASGAYRTHKHDGSSDDGAAALSGVTGLTAAGNLDIGSYELRAQTLEADVATGTAPLTIASTTKVTNLNADKVDGYDVSNGSGDIPISNGTICTNLNADKLDGQTGSYYTDLANVSGNLSVNRLNSGTGASSSTFWRGDGSWGAATTSLGAWVVATEDTVYLAATDGFVTAWGSGIGSLYGYTDGSTPPTTLRDFSSSGNGNANITFPVRKGDYWKVLSEIGGEHVMWIPLGT